MLLAEETSGNHQAYWRGHLDITILNEIRAAKECSRNYLRKNACFVNLLVVLTNVLNFR